MTANQQFHQSSGAPHPASGDWSKPVSERDLRHVALFAGGGPGWSQTNVSMYLVCGLALQGYTVDFVTLNSTQEDLKSLYGMIDGFERVNVYPLGVKNARSSIPPLIHYYKTQNPDVLFSQLTYFNAIAIFARLLAGSNTRNILIEGTLLSKMINSDSKFSFKLMSVPLLARLIYPFAQGFIAKSVDILTDTQTVVGNRFKRVDSIVLPNPYPFERFQQLAEEDLDHPWFTDQTLPVIVSSGRLCEQKGFDLLLQALADLQSSIPCRLIILGEGPDRPELESLIKKLNLEDRVELPGRVSNPWKYVKRSTIFVLASRWEGWPSALMEAMSIGTPVITTDCPGDGKKMVEHGKTGLIVPVNTISALREALFQLLSHPSQRSALASSAQTSILKYDYKNISKRYAEFAEALISSSKTLSQAYCPE